MCGKEVSAGDGVNFVPHPVGEDVDTETEYERLEQVCLCNACLREGGNRNYALSDTVQSPESAGTTVWQNGVMLSGLLILIGPPLLVSSVDPAITTINPIGWIALLWLLIGWVSMPLCGYYDIKQIKTNSNWEPRTLLWIIGMMAIFVNIAVAAVYSYRRYEVLILSAIVA